MRRCIFSFTQLLWPVHRYGIAPEPGPWNNLKLVRVPEEPPAPAKPASTVNDTAAADSNSTASNSTESPVDAAADDAAASAAAASDDASAATGKAESDNAQDAAVATESAAPAPAAAAESEAAPKPPKPRKSKRLSGMMKRAYQSIIDEHMEFITLQFHRSEKPDAIKHKLCVEKLAGAAAASCKRCGFWLTTLLVAACKVPKPKDEL